MQALLKLFYTFSLFIMLSGYQSIEAQNVNFQQRAVVAVTDESLANIWGYAVNGQEFALVGAQKGMRIYNITNPAAPQWVTTIPGPDNLWKEIKTFSHYAYVVSEGGWGVQVVDLSGLATNTLPLAYHSVYPVIPGEGIINRSHALQVDETRGFLYLYGSRMTNNTSAGYPVVCDLNSDPYNPVYVGRYTVSGYAHDGYADDNMMYASHIYSGQFSIVDMTDKNSPAVLGANVTTPGTFTHNTWKSGNTIFTTDEVSNSYLAAYDITDPSDVSLADVIQVTPGSGSIVHNVYCLNHYAIASWYTDGVVIVDATRPRNLVVTGWFDTYSGSGSGFNGCWGVYPFFPSGTVIASNIYGTGTNVNSGELYVLTPTYERACHLEGLVTNASTNQPLGGALIELLSSGVANETSETTTGPDKGTYRMGRRGGGSFTLRVSLAGYQTYTTTVALSTGNLTIANIPLQPLAPVPVEMTRFEAKVNQNQSVTLLWTTATERNNAGFEVQQSADGQHWTALAQVPAAANPLEENHYQVTSSRLVPGLWCFRLIQKNNDGTETYSDVRCVAVEGGNGKITVSPNPSTDYLNIRFMEADAADYIPGRITVYDNAFCPVLEIPTDDALHTSVHIPVNHLVPGAYWMLIQGSRQSTFLPVIKQ